MISCRLEAAGVAVVVGGQVLEQQLLDMGQTLHHRLADLLGAARALLPLRMTSSSWRSSLS